MPKLQESFIFVHLQEGSDLLGDEELGKTRSGTAALKDEEEEDEGEQDAESSEEENGREENGSHKPAVKRDGTMVVTAAVRSSIASFLNHSKLACNYFLSFAYRSPMMLFLSQEGEKFLEDAGHEIDGGTRGETEAVKAAIEESEGTEQNGEKEAEKTDLKRKGTMQETIEVKKTVALSALIRFGTLFRYPLAFCLS